MVNPGVWTHHNRRDGANPFLLKHQELSDRYLLNAERRGTQLGRHDRLHFGQNDLALLVQQRQQLPHRMQHIASDRLQGVESREEVKCEGVACRVVVRALERVRMNNHHTIDTMDVRKAHDANQVTGKECQQKHRCQGISVTCLFHVRFNYFNRLYR